MKTFFVVGSYCDTDSFADPIDVFDGFGKAAASRYLFHNFQVQINENKPSAQSFEHKTLEDVINCPVVSDGYSFWGLFKVKANNEEEAKLLQLKVNQNQVV